jgi:hypothetical protein
MRNLILVNLAVAMLLVACGGPPATSTPQGGDATAAPPADGGGGSTVAACDLLTDEDVEQVTGQPVEEMVAGPVLGIFENGCEWTLEAGTAGVEASLTVGVISPGGRRYYESFFEPFIGEEGGHVEALSGIGDKASRDEFGGIMAVKGDTLVDVSYTTYPAPDDDVITPLIRAALARVAN